MSSQTKFRFAHSYGFTLSEVLITISIIGIIAVLTVPNLIQKQKERILITQFKKAYAEISNAVDSAFIQNRDEIFAESYSFSKYIAPYLSLEKTCNNTKNCMPSIEYEDLVLYDYKTFQNKGFGFCNRSGKFYENSCFASRLILKNGMLIYAIDVDYRMKEGKMGVWVDINGEKGPNKNGVDLYSIGIDKDKGVYPGLNKYCDYNVPNLAAASCTKWILVKNNMNYLHKKITPELNELLNN